MFNFSGSEIVFLLLLALIILGPEKLPEAIRKFGKTYAEFKKVTTGFQSELRNALDEPMREMRETADMFKQAATFDGVADLLDDAKTTFDATVQEATGAVTGTSTPAVTDAAAAAPPLAPSATPSATPTEATTTPRASDEPDTADEPDASDAPDLAAPAADEPAEPNDDTADPAQTAEVAPRRSLDDLVIRNAPVQRAAKPADADGPANA